MTSGETETGLGLKEPLYFSAQQCKQAGILREGVEIWMFLLWVKSLVVAS